MEYKRQGTEHQAIALMMGPSLDDL